ncbi:penicillin-binding protein [Brevibacillus reuszeri]|uniref:Penicillin-binding protein n=2 Tax=Brevibacillus reuszeri TaxID=54915 RepID=A0ABQ0TXK5_9BACL|nr:serine hydrolase domain-containing protein [Brevibacillus reuszeri]MED1859296.1 serine hydrolase [Brevibacillus reuszeri]GED72636.1 penicillin-binding protein [Brevibacillus reuszeri]
MDMQLKRQESDRFQEALIHVQDTYNTVVGTGAAFLVIHNGAIVCEQYWGRQGTDAHARAIQPDTQFHVASVRKSYIGFAVAYAVYHGHISSIDDPVMKYLPELDSLLLNGTTLRHLLTHTHGLHMKNDELIREFAPGLSWSYRGAGIDMLTRIVKETTGKTVAQVLSENVFEPLGFTQSGWYGTMHDKLVDVIRLPNDTSWRTSESTAGDQMNMYVSTRELAYWGYLHLNQGMIDGRQVVDKEMFELATSLQSPELRDKNLPQNGYLWFVKDLPANLTEIGDHVPKDSYQILGYTGVTLLVIPHHELVAVRMFNSFGSPPGYDYLADVRGFGDRIMQCIEKSK